MSNVRVAVRVRPLTKREEAQGAKVIVGIERDRLLVTNLKVPVNKEHDSRLRTRQFGFDFCYWSADDKSQHFASQEMIYEDIGSNVLEAVFEGFNACVLAYGQSGSGKTYTMMGQNGDLGLTPRICQGLFDRLMKVTDKQLTFRTEVSFLEIYNERVGDLLRPPMFSKQQQQRRRPTLRVREHPKLGPCVQDLSKHVVNDFNGVQALIERGLQNRSVAATRMHDHSSRSHAIFTINFIQARLDEDLPSEVVSKIHLVDLAGSERATVGMNKIRLKEGANINKSLVALGSVICALAEKSMSLWSLDSLSSSKSHTSSTGDSFSTCSTSSLGSSSHRGQQTPFVPYRDSVLTWLLKDSLGGNSKTIMVATISPSSTAYNETLSTLRYAQRTKCIVNKPIINEDPNVKLIRELKAEINRLRELLSTTNQNGMMKFSGEIPVSEIITRNQDKAQELTRCWIEKWHYFQKQAQETMCNTCSSKANMAGIIECSTPYLLGKLNLFTTDGVQIVCFKDGDKVVSNCPDGQSNTKPVEILSLPSCDTSKCKLCDSDMSCDQNEDSNGPILKALLSDSEESSESELKFVKNSILPNNTNDDENNTIESRNVESFMNTATAENGFDDETIEDDLWSDTDDFPFYAFEDQEEVLQYEESEATLCGSSDVDGEKMRHSIRYLSPIEECPSSQSQSPVTLPCQVDEDTEISQNMTLNREEHSKDVETDDLQCRDISADIDLDSLDENESRNVLLTLECTKSTEEQPKIVEPRGSTLSTKQSDSVPSLSQNLSCYHIGFVSSDDDISGMDTDLDVVPSVSSKPLDISKSNSSSVPLRRGSLDMRSKKQTYYNVSNRINCLSSSSSDDDTSHSHNSSHIGNTYKSTRQQKFQRIVMENRRKRRHKKTSPKKEATSRCYVYRDRSRTTSEKSLRNSISPLPLPRPSLWKEQETLSSSLSSLSQQPIMSEKLNKSVDDASKSHEIEKNFNVADPNIESIHFVTKENDLTLLDCSFTTDSLENLSSRCPSQNERNTCCWTYNYGKVEPIVVNSTLKKQSKRCSAFKHSWPSCDSLTMVYMGPEWGSTETNLVASIQSLDDQDWCSSDMGLASSTKNKNNNETERNVLKKSFSDGCLNSKWNDVAPSSLSVPEVTFTPNESETYLRLDAANFPCRLLVPEPEIQIHHLNPRESIKNVELPQQQQRTNSKRCLQTVPITEITLNEKPEKDKSFGDGGFRNVATEPWNSNGAWMKLSTFYQNNYELDDNQDELSFCEDSSVKTEKQSICTFRVVSTKTESSSDSGFQTEVATNLTLENASSQTSKVTREGFSQTSKLSNETYVQTDPICLVISTQTDPIRMETHSQTEHRVSECIQTTSICQQRDTFSQTENTLCKDVSMQTSFDTIPDAATLEHADINTFLDIVPVSEPLDSSSGEKLSTERAENNNAILNLVKDSNNASFEGAKFNDSKICDSGIYIGFHGKNNSVQSLSIKFNSSKSKCLSNNDVECRTNDTILFQREETEATIYLPSAECSPEESPGCNQIFSSLDNFRIHEKDIDVDCTVSEYSNDVTVSYPPDPLDLSPSTSSLNHHDVNDSTTPAIMDNDSCNEDARLDDSESKTVCDVTDVQQQSPVLIKFQCSDDNSPTVDKEESKQCFNTLETSCTSFTQTDFNDILQMNTLKAFLYSSLGCGTGQLDFQQFDIFTEMESRIKALEVQCSEILIEQQKCAIDCEKYIKKETSVERPRKKNVELRQSSRDNQKLISECVKKHVRDLECDNYEDYYRLPNTLKLNCNYLHKRKKLCKSENSKEIEDVVVTKTESITELPPEPFISLENSDDKYFSGETMKTVDPLLPLVGILEENISQISEPVTREVENPSEYVSVVTGTSEEVSTLECQLKKSRKPYFKEEDSEEDYGNNIPEDILALLRECKAVRKRAWVEINLAHQQLGY